MKRLRLRKWVKIVISMLLIVVGFGIYHYLGVLGSYASKNIFASIIIPFGWFWLLVGQIMVFYVMWEN